MKEPPQALFGLLISDIVNALRGALENLVWELSVKHSGPPPPNPLPFRDPWRKVRSPVVIGASTWPSMSRRNLWAVDPTLLTKFERLQPFRRRKRHLMRHEFWVLDELWSIDKHRRRT